MKYDPLSHFFYAQNRTNLAARLEPGSIAVIHSADMPWTSADGHTRFIQDSDLFYLTGVDQEETILVLCPSHPDPHQREILFVRETSEQIAIWEGPKLTQERAREVSGIAHVCWTHAFDRSLRRLARQFRTIYLNQNEHQRTASPVNHTLNDRFRLHCQSLYPHHRYLRLAPLLHELRVVKGEEEIRALQQACDITGKGFERVLRFVRPGVHEYEIEAELLHEFVRHGSRGFAYEPIIASGASANILHYIENDQRCREGELILMDVAAEYGNYNADLTRTVPVSGRFTPRQRQVYEAVLRILRLCIDRLIVPGKAIRKEYHAEVARHMEDELIALGLLEAATVASERETPDLPEEKRSYRQYFMHGVSHSLGLDVHDVTPPDAVFLENMCVTVEPGIYLPEEGFGIRLENDIIVRAEGNLDLMAHIPIEPDDIEALMGEQRLE